MTDIFPEKVNWSRVLDDLKGCGWSVYAVAKAMGKKYDTVQGWREHEPKHADGVALLTLHARECRALCSTANIPENPCTDKTV